MWLKFCSRNSLNLSLSISELYHRKELRDNPPAATGAGKEETVWDDMERVALDHEMIEYLFEYRDTIQ